MVFEAEIRSLGSADKDIRSAAARAMSGYGAAAVTPLIEHLCDESSPIEWSMMSINGRAAGSPICRSTCAAVEGTHERRGAGATFGS
ncbi:hypothetical protein GCM10009839_49710 [Catenulispora yoronensis]|uniref:HEAT repeat domain-containing protein n=1 Tax=Catenulispora yoronensis TaxID=450799 RepID=A0ABN2UPI3_9ACTN